MNCIKLEDYNCTLIENNNNYDFYFWDTVPERLSNHPLRNQTVCRKCHLECFGCIKDGSHLYDNCNECKHYYSNSTATCVHKCSNATEYLVRGIKV